MTITATPITTGGWQAVTLTPIHNDMPVWEAIDTQTGQMVGTVSEWTPGLWQAHRIGHSAESAATLGQAMSMVDWLLCVHAGELATRFDPSSPVRLVLADGTIATVNDAYAYGLKVTFCLDVRPQAQFDMAHPPPVSALSMSTEVPAGPDRPTAQMLATFAYVAQLALAPACSECGTDSGEVCHPFAAHDFF